MGEEMNQASVQAAGQTGTRSLAPAIGEEQIAEALVVFEKYRSAKNNYTQKIVNAEEWWKSKHWERFESESSNENDPRPVSAWLFNSIINKHADFMDNMPCPVVLPREKSDEPIAELLTQVIPKILEQNEFQKTYSACCWDKPKTGTGIYGVFWNQEKDNGLGDVDIRQIDILNLFWQPGVEDIQKSRNIFSIDMVDKDELISEYPFLKGKIENQAILYKPEYVYEDNIDTSDKIQVIDWYYKKKVYAEVEGSRVARTVLHYCKFIPGYVLYATENDPEMADGWYKDGKYPFVFDTLFPEKGMPVGFGYIDIMVNPQEFVDKLDQIILKVANMQRPRYFVKQSAGVNKDDFSDLSKDIVETPGDVSPDSIRQIDPPQMSDVVINARTMKIEEIKETSGNRDFSQGSTTSGVTAASAIAALQEAGSKLSRDMIKGTYEAYSGVVTMVIERIRQFYDLPRCYRVTMPNGTVDYVTLENQKLMPQDLSMRRPAFDISVSAQKASPYSRIANNELAKELYGMGIFNPQNADQALAVISMMDFDKKDEVLKKVSQNGTMYQQLQRMSVAMQQMAGLIAKSTGDTRILDSLPQMLEGMGDGGTALRADAVAEGELEVNSLGEAKNRGNGMDEQARERVARSTEV